MIVVIELVISDNYVFSQLVISDNYVFSQLVISDNYVFPGREQSSLSPEAVFRPYDQIVE